MLLWFRHGWREESAQIVLVAMVRVVSYAGGAMIGAARRTGAAAATAAVLVAMVWRGRSECGGWTVKESSSSIEQKQKKLEINGELDN